MEAEKIELKIVITSLFLIFLAEVAAGLFFSNVQMDSYIKIGILRIVEIGLLTLLVLFWGKGFSSIGFEKEKISSGILYGFYYSSLFGIIAGAGALIMWLTGVDPLSFFQFHINHSPSLIVQLFIVGGLIAPVAEEILFRGILYGYLRKWGIWTAIILSTLIFVIMHSAQTIPVTQAVGGIVFAFSYEKTKSLLTPIIIHIIGNCAIFLLTLL